MKKRAESPFLELSAYRKSRGESQAVFWARFGVTQSGGSRYESGMRLPVATGMLVLAFVDGLLDDENFMKLSERLRERNLQVAGMEN